MIAFLSLFLVFVIAVTRRRATGQLLTPATWMRQFVTSHAAYKQDSVICPEIAHDLLMTCKGIGEGSIHCPELLGDITIDR